MTAFSTVVSDPDKPPLSQREFVAVASGSLLDCSSLTHSLTTGLEIISPSLVGGEESRGVHTDISTSQTPSPVIQD